MKVLVTAIFLAAATQNVAFATPVTVNLTAILGDVGQNYFGGGVVDYFHVGDSVSFSFTYTPDDSVVAGDPNGFKYVVTEFSLNTSAYQATVLNRGAINLQNNVWGGSDVFSMSSGYWSLMQGYGVPLDGVPLLNGDYLSDIGLSLYSSSGSAFNNASLAQPLRLSDFDSGSFYFAFREPGTTLAMGTMQSWNITSLESTLNSVPEPETYALLLLGIGLTGAVSSRRRKSIKNRLFW